MLGCTNSDGWTSLTQSYRHSSTCSRGYFGANSALISTEEREKNKKTQASSAIYIPILGVMLQIRKQRVRVNTATTSIWVHLTMTYGGSPWWDELKHFPDCFSRSFILREKRWGISLDALSASDGRCNELWPRCKKPFLKVNTSPPDRSIASVLVCRSVWLFLPSWPQNSLRRHTDPHTMTRICVIFNPIIQIHAPPQLFNHWRGLWDAGLEDNNNRAVDIGWAAVDTDFRLSSSTRSWPWRRVRGGESNCPLFACRPPLSSPSHLIQFSLS